jgi:RNA polymerase sigma-70 factor (ECF subfamily)
VDVGYNHSTTLKQMDYRALTANELAEQCRSVGSADAWNEFVRRFQRPIALVVLRTARGWGVTSTALIDDLVQEVFLRLCANECLLLRSFVARKEDSVVGYLKVIAANVTHDHLRGEKRIKRGGITDRRMEDYGELDTLLAAPGQAAAADKAIELREIDEALQSFVPHVLTERDRTIFWLYFKQGFSARDISTIESIGLTIKGVESSIHRATNHVRATSKGFPKLPPIYQENG